MSNFFNKNLHIYLFIFILSSIIHYFYYQHAPGVIISEDTYSYYLAGEQIIKSKIPVHYSRPPAYPLFLHLITFLSGYPLEPMMTASFSRTMMFVIILQSVMVSLSNVLLYLTLIKIKIKPLFSLGFVLFTTFNIIIFSWFRLLLTEAMAVFFLALLFYLTVSILIRPKNYHFIFLLFLLILSVMLRPFFLLLPLVPLLVISFYFRMRKIYLISAILLTVYFLSISLYSRLNFKQYGLNGLTTVSFINPFGKVLLYNLNIENSQKYSYFYQKVKEYRGNLLPPNPYRFMEYYQLINAQAAPTNIMEMKHFANKVIISNLPEFLFKGIKEIPNAYLDVSEKLILLPANKSLSAYFFRLIYYFYKNSQYLFFATLLLCPLYIVRFLLKKNLASSIMGSLSGIILYQTLTAVYMGYDEFGRLLVPAQPLMYLFIFLSIYSFIRKTY